MAASGIARTHAWVGHSVIDNQHVVQSGGRSCLKWAVTRVVTELTQQVVMLLTEQLAMRQLKFTGFIDASRAGEFEVGDHCAWVINYSLAAFSEPDAKV